MAHYEDCFDCVHCKCCGYHCYICDIDDSGYRADLSAESLNVSKNNAATAQYKRRGCVILIKGNL